MNCKCDCQLIALYNASLELNIIDKIWLIYIRLRAAFLRRLKKVGSLLKRKFFDKTDSESDQVALPKDTSNKSTLQAGDMVQILTYDEIKKNLNKDNKTQGLYFMTPMKKYCGKTSKVLKRVNCMFDEQSWGMIKIKNVVILEEVICDGKDMAPKEGCARSCFWFWKEAWLRKI
jgi:hypothetical protein